MANLTNPRHEAFAQYVAQGKTDTEAYMLAFDWDESRRSAAGKSAHTLKKKAEVAARIDEIRERNARMFDVTIENLTAELNEAGQFARDAKDAKGLTTAVMAKAKLHGLLIDKVEQETKLKTDANDLTDDELAAIAAGGGKVAAGPAQRPKGSDSVH